MAISSSKYPLVALLPLRVPTKESGPQRNMSNYQDKSLYTPHVCPRWLFSNILFSLVDAETFFLTLESLLQLQTSGRTEFQYYII